MYDSSITPRDRSSYIDPSTTDTDKSFETEAPKTQSELDKLGLPPRTIKSRYLDKKTGQLNTRGKKKYGSNITVLKISTTGRKKRFWRKNTAGKTKHVAVDSDALRRAMKPSAQSTGQPSSARFIETSQAPKGKRAQDWEDAVQEWEVWDDNILPNAVTPKFLEGVLIEDNVESDDELVVYLQRINGNGELEVGPVTVSASALAESLGVTDEAVNAAFYSGDVEGLIIRARLTPDEHLETTYSETKTGLTASEARSVAMAVDGLRDEGLIYGQEVDPSTPHLRYFNFDMPRDLEVGPKPEDNRSLATIFVHLGTKKIKALGVGGFGKVTKSLHEALGTHTKAGAKTEVVAQKVPRFDAENTDLDVQKKEAEFATRLQGVPYVMQVHHYSEIGPGDAPNLSIVSEMCDGGDMGVWSDDDNMAILGENFEKMTPAEQWEFFAKALEGVDGIHKKGVIHRDLKPANIMLKTGKDGAFEPRIVDFGLCADEDALAIPGGSLDFLPPEAWLMFLGAKGDFPTKPSWDAYSMGIVALQGILKAPLPSVNAQTIMDIAQTMGNMETADWVGDSIAQTHINVPMSIQMALQGLLNPDPDARMSISEAIDLIREGITEL